MATGKYKSGFVEDLKIYPKAIVFKDVIGQGASGQLWKGEWKEKDVKKDVTVKAAVRFKKDDPEIKMLRKLDHPNVVHLFGVVEDKPSYFIILEYVENGSLYDFLYKDKKKPNPEQTLRWPREIARGLEYLHHLKMIHRDMKSSSVLLTADFSVKLSGFGSQKQFEPDLLPRMSLAFRWMAPEVHNEEPVSFFCDVFSFGMVLWEILECKLPFEEITSDLEIKVEIAAGKTPAIPDSCEDYIKEVLKMCWKKDPKERPTSFRILSILEKGSIATNESSADDTTPSVSKTSEIAKDDIEKEEQLGKEDQDSTVYVGYWKSQEMKVAVKSSSLDLSEDQAKKEIVILKQLQHPNIIQFYGFVNKRPTVLIITELAENGSLYNFLHVDKLYPNHEQTRRWPQEIADGMNCLHKHDYAHRDLSSKNIILSRNWTVKLTGFESAKKADHTTMQTLVGGSRWTAPEILEGAKKVNSKLSDVFSYGMVVFEIYTCKLPYEDVPETLIKHRIIAGDRPTERRPLPPHISELLQMCWKVPEERPTFRDILSTFEKISTDPSQAVPPVDDSDGSLKESDVDQIADKLQDVALMWYPLGNGLKLGRDDLIMGSGDPTASLKTVITKWIRSGDPPPTVEVLAECVSSMLGREDLAKALREEFGK